MKFYERVISDYGGYEKCKDILNQPNIGLIMNAQALRSHMLEYRRQHNIFEVDDLVVEIAESPETSILKVIYMSEHLMVCENDRLNASYGVLNKKPSSYVRHATEEEIKAGHRL